ncbi:uncharacterized protein BCR38DRAFT_455438 [Pseudomassariella vexata]|uniref:Uncharacterized protein n=1 Tax=Pseudomassariella vexata TaxID=1141098 RepID=A0A1Y2EA55_9PEZI|nr:uncharacterized protein BCR38DRAFT_455438 [Pseudomassariella vexata]ORY68468.1 hypothetical protein BCR38DRAFT_455438 [Pseudomassariella vexata]
MPALLSSSSLLTNPVARNAISNSTTSSFATNVTSNALQVVCAWPVSGQYGPGSRVLYYVLVATCVLARKAEWLRNACLAAALLFPAVAAIHGIVLAVLHVNGAVDMDVFGAFQLCSIGILAGPVTVRRSKTYFYDPGRNAIFLWTLLILAGLLSLTVEFYRITTSKCTHDDNGNPIPRDVRHFPYEQATCDLICSIDDGPFSRMRRGAAIDIYVIPAPDKLTFGAGMLVSAACCIPAILSLVSMWNKILEINWRTTRFAYGTKDERIDEPIEGTNGATLGEVRRFDTKIRRFLSTVVEIPVIGSAVLAIVVFGERNFFSYQVYFQTEPMASIGQWAPMVGTGLAAFGSLYLLLAKDPKGRKGNINPDSTTHFCNCSHHHHSDERQMSEGYRPGSRYARSMHGGVFETSPRGHTDSLMMQEVDAGLSTFLSEHDDIRRSFSNESELAPTTSRSGQSHHIKRTWTADAGRRKAAETLTAIGDFLGTAAPGRFDDSEFKLGKANDFPEIPGEEQRNRALRQIRERYNQPRDAEGHATPALRKRPSRAGSFTGSFVSVVDGEDSTDPHSPQSPSHPMFPSPATTRRPHSNTFPCERNSFDTYNPHPPSSDDPAESGLLPRRSTLEVPSPVYHGSTRNNPTSSSATSFVASPETSGTPAIVVSSGPDESSTTPTLIINPPAPL